MGFGHNFWLGGSIDKGSMRLNCILQDLFRDTPLDHILFTVVEHVPFQISSFIKWISAFCTFVSPFTSVGNHVCLQVPCLTKWLLTFCASVGLHATGPDLTKRFVALNTSLPPFFAVCYYVSLQISCLTKWLPTIWTEVHFFSILGDHMTRHFVSPWRGFETELYYICKVNPHLWHAWTDLNTFAILFATFTFSHWVY